jgi:hypothetical protein
VGHDNQTINGSKIWHRCIGGSFCSCLGAAGCLRGRPGFNREKRWFKFLILSNGERRRQSDNIGKTLFDSLRIFFHPIGFQLAIQYPGVDTK